MNKLRPILRTLGISNIKPTSRIDDKFNQIVDSVGDDYTISKIWTDKCDDQTMLFIYFEPKVTAWPPMPIQNVEALYTMDWEKDKKKATPHFPEDPDPWHGEFLPH